MLVKKGVEVMTLSNLKLKYKIIIPTTLIIAMLFFVNLIWNYENLKTQSENEMYEKAQVIAYQLDATWTFMDINQDLINYDANGEFNFKGLHCSIVGLSIGTIMSRETDYTIAYVRETPRNIMNTPDEYELAGIYAFQTDSSLIDISEVTTDDEGNSIFRYLEPMYIEESCLECHGEPAGEVDISGYPKDGMEIGDFIGLISISMPTDMYDANVLENTQKNLLFFLVLVVIAAIAIYIFISKFITTPLNTLGAAAKQIGEGDLDIDLDNLHAEGEIQDLADTIELMSHQLQDLYNDLEGKVNTRTIQLGEANTILLHQQQLLEETNEKLLQDNQYKNDFLAMVSHELKTPLTSIILFLDILENEDTQNNLEDRTAIINKARDNGRRLLQMINNILYLSRIEANKLEIASEAVDLADLLSNIGAIIEPQVLAKDITYTTEIERGIPLICGDYEKLRCVIENVLGNAIKFTNKGGAIGVRVFMDNSNINITIADTGIGISESDMEVIFDRFIQSDSSDIRSYGGSGLGLALAREFVKYHQGTITVKSVLGKGSCFIIELPEAIIIKEEEI